MLLRSIMANLWMTKKWSRGEEEERWIGPLKSVDVTTAEVMVKKDWNQTRPGVGAGLQTARDLPATEPTEGVLPIYSLGVGQLGVWSSWQSPLSSVLVQGIWPEDRRNPLPGPGGPRRWQLRSFDHHYWLAGLWESCSMRPGELPCVERVLGDSGDGVTEVRGLEALFRTVWAQFQVHSQGENLRLCSEVGHSSLLVAVDAIICPSSGWQKVCPDGKSTHGWIRWERRSQGWGDTGALCVATKVLDKKTKQCGLGSQTSYTKSNNFFHALALQVLEECEGCSDEGVAISYFPPKTAQQITAPGSLFLSATG